MTFELIGVSGAGQFAPEAFVDDVFVANMNLGGLTTGKHYPLGISSGDALYLGGRYSVKMAAHRIPEQATLVLVWLAIVCWGAPFQMNKTVAS